MNRARSLRKHSPTKSHPRDKTGKKLISRDFLASDCWQQLFDHDSCESGSAGSSLPLSSIFDRLEYRMNSKALLFEGFFELAKEQGLLGFFFDDMG